MRLLRHRWYKYRFKHRSRTVRLSGGPHARGLVVRVCIMNPKKPNSAMRHVAKMKLYRKPRVTARIPGRGFGVSKFNRALVRGGRANDLPGVSYSLCRGVYDFAPLFGKKKRRSFYGLPRPSEAVKHVRRRDRNKEYSCVSRIQVGSYPIQFGAIPKHGIGGIGRAWVNPRASPYLEPGPANPGETPSLGWLGGGQKGPNLSR